MNSNSSSKEPIIYFQNVLPNFDWTTRLLFKNVALNSWIKFYDASNKYTLEIFLKKEKSKMNLLTFDFSIEMQKKHRIGEVFVQFGHAKLIKVKIVSLTLWGHP